MYLTIKTKRGGLGNEDVLNSPAFQAYKKFIDGHQSQPQTGILDRFLRLPPMERDVWMYVFVVHTEGF